MRALVCHSFGPLTELRVEVVDPEPCAADQARVSIRAAGVNFVDVLLAQGRYQIKPPLPFRPGGEIAGVVTEVGESVDPAWVGRRVFAFTGVGGFAEEIVVPVAALQATPDVLTDGQAATFAQSYCTAWFALVHRARARAGQSLLVLGAGGGVGLAAVDVGRHLGLRVAAVGSSAEKRACAAAAGAERLIDPVEGSIKDQARAWMSGGVDLVYDPVGGELAEQGLRALADDGQLLVIGFASGTIPALPANQILLRNRRVTGVDWGGWAAKHHAENREMVAEVVGAIAVGSLRPVEPTSCSLSDAVRALTDVAERRAVGKIALVPWRPVR